MASFTPYTDINPATAGTRVEGQCTQWCYNRTLAAFGTPCLTSYGNASTWLTSGTLGSDWSRYPYDTNIQSGDVLVYTDGGAGHVLFVESASQNIITQSNVRYPGGTYASQWSSLINGRHEMWSCTNPSNLTSGYLGMTYLGRLHYGGSGGGTPAPPSQPETTAKSFATITNSPCAVNGSVTISLNRSFNAGGEVYWNTGSPVGVGRSLGTFSAGTTSVTLPLGNAFEALMPNETSKTFYLRVNGYFTDDRTAYWGGKNTYYHDGLSFTVTIPNAYKPTINITTPPSVTGDYKTYPVAGYSEVSIRYTVTSTAPSGYQNTATIKKSNFALNRGHATISGTSSSGTISLDPLPRSYEDYTLSLSASATDSRNRSVETVKDNLLTVKGYRVPQVTINRFYRCRVDTSEGVQQDVNGPALYIEFKVDLSLEQEGNSISTEDISLNVGEDNYTDLVQKSGDLYSILFTAVQLDPDTKYQVSLTLQDDVMKYFGTSPITTAELYLTRIPLSLYDDDDNRVGVAFGKEAEYPNTVEFASNMSIRVTDLSTGDVKTKTAYDVLRGTEEEVAQLYETVESLEDEVAVRAKSSTGMTLLPLTQAQYDRLTTKDSNTLYLIFED